MIEKISKPDDLFVLALEEMAKLRALLNTNFTLLLSVQFRGFLIYERSFCVSLRGSA